VPEMVRLLQPAHYCHRLARLLGDYPNARSQMRATLFVATQTAREDELVSRAVRRNCI
jgi:hypothetical protein